MNPKTAASIRSTTKGHAFHVFLKTRYSLTIGISDVHGLRFILPKTFHRHTILNAKRSAIRIGMDLKSA